MTSFYYKEYPVSILKWASMHGKLDILQHLKITETCPISMVWAGTFGHVKVVKFLHENGMPITKNAINWAIFNNQGKVLDYMKTKHHILADKIDAVKYYKEKQDSGVIKVILGEHFYCKISMYDPEHYFRIPE
jgi:hypothetical protein